MVKKLKVWFLWLGAVFTLLALHACQKSKLETSQRGLGEMITVKDAYQTLEIINWGEGETPKDLSNYQDYLPSSIEVKSHAEKTAGGEIVFSFSWSFAPPKKESTTTRWNIEGNILTDDGLEKVQSLNIPISSTSNRTSFSQNLKAGKRYTFKLKWAALFSAFDGKILIIDTSVKQIDADLSRL